MSMLNLLSMTLTVLLGASARRRRELINDLREELDPQE